MKLQSMFKLITKSKKGKDNELMTYEDILNIIQDGNTNYTQFNQDKTEFKPIGRSDFMG